MATPRLFAAIVTLAIAATHLFAAEPVIRNLDIRGLHFGTTTLTIDGDDLGKAPRLLLPFPIKQVLKPGATDKRAVFDVTVDKNASPGGYHQLRVFSENGVSLPVIIGSVDSMRQQLITEPIKSVPTALHGSLAGAQIAETKFDGKAKQKVMIEVEAQRLGSKLRPIVHLYNAKKLQLAWAWGTPALSGDCRIETTLPEDGQYTLTLHDAEYAAPAGSFYRLKIGEWQYVDQVFPPVVSRSDATRVELLGNVAKLTEDLKGGDSPGVVALHPYLTPGAWSGPRPYAVVSTHAEYLEQPTKDLQMIPQGPAGVSGRLSNPYEEDRYRIAVTPGKKVRLEVFAERIGSPIDCAVAVRNDQGAQLARAEDSPGTLDPVLEYTVPEKVTSIVVGVVDAQGRGGPRGIYRLVIEPQDAAKDAFKLTTTAQRFSLPAGGSTVVPVQIDRKGGYQGPVELTCEPALPGLKLDGASIPASADGTLVTIRRADTNAEPAIVNLRGKTAAAEQTVIVKNHPLERLQPWLANEIGVARNAENAKEFTVDWRDLSEKTVISPASRLLLPVKLVRPDGKNTVKLTLVTSQNTPMLNNQPDPNKALRQDKLGELAAKVNTGDVTMLVPPDLSAPTYDVTVQAELLDPAKKVLATAYAPVRRMQVVLPIIVKLDGPSRIETQFDPKKGATLQLKGTLDRREGLKADVALALTGLPAGAKADAVTIKADAASFVVNVTFPPNVPAAEYTGIKLSGSFAPDAKQPNVRVKSREVEVTLVLKAIK